MNEPNQMKTRSEKAFDKRLATFFKKSSAKTWDQLAHTIIPGTGRTVWQAWIAVDGGAPLRVDSRTEDPLLTPEMIWRGCVPDSFTIRRAIKAAREGKVEADFSALLSRRGPPVPR